MGKTPSRNNVSYWKNDYNWISIADMAENEIILKTKEKISSKAFIEKFNSKIVPKDTLIMSFKLTVGRVSIIGIDSLHNEAIISIFPYDDSEFIIRNYLFYILPSIVQYAEIKKAIKGNTLNSNSLNKLIIPVAPKAETNRIINTLKNIFQQIKIKDVNEEKIIKLREKLKTKILDKAIRGELVSQCESDEPSSVLVNRILNEKRQLIKSKEIKKENLSIIYKDCADNQFYEKFDDSTITNITDEIPFDIPENWCWNRLGNISTYGVTKNKINSKNANPDTWILDMEDIEKGGKILRQNKLKDKNSIGDKTIFKKGNILYSKLRPYLKKILIAPEDGICTPELVPFEILGNINPIFIINYLKSPYVDFKINQVTYGAKMPRVGNETMINLLIPIPPVDEQEKIISKINKIFKTAE